MLTWSTRLEYELSVAEKHALHPDLPANTEYQWWKGIISCSEFGFAPTLLCNASHNSPYSYIIQFHDWIFHLLSLISDTKIRNNQTSYIFLCLFIRVLGSITSIIIFFFIAPNLSVHPVSYLVISITQSNEFLTCDQYRISISLVICIVTIPIIICKTQHVWHDTTLQLNFDWEA